MLNVVGQSANKSQQICLEEKMNSLVTRSSGVICYIDWHPLSMNRVYWEWAGGSEMPAIEFTGVPFMFVGTKKLVCHQGRDLALAQKRRYAEEKAKKMVSFGYSGKQK